MGWAVDKITGKHLSEKSVIKKLGVESLKSIKAGQGKDIGNLMFDYNLDDSTVRGLCQQLKAFPKDYKDIVNSIQISVDHAVNRCVDDTDKVYAGCQTTLDTISHLLENNDFTNEERTELIEYMVKVNRMMVEIHTDNRSFIERLGNWKYVILLGLGLAGGGTAFKLISSDSNDDDDDDDENKVIDTKNHAG